MIIWILSSVSEKSSNMCRIYLFLVAIGLMSLCLEAKRAQFYRKDYTYVEKYDAFYKLHWDLNGLSWSSAFLTCDDEGAKLFYPKDNDEWTVAQSLAQNMTEQPNITEIFVGLHDEFHLGEFITIDGHSTESPMGVEDTNVLPQKCVLMDIVTGTFRTDECQRTPVDPVPFICKKVDEESCPTIDHEYKFVKAANKCYKVHKKQKMWQHAMQTCFMEGGLLTVMETEAEINNIRHLIVNNEIYYVGFRNLFNAGFFTVKGKLYENIYFEKWYEAQDNIGRDCGIYKLYAYNNQNKVELEDCQQQHHFICEMDTIRK